MPGRKNGPKTGVRSLFQVSHIRWRAPRAWAIFCYPPQTHQHGASLEVEQLDLEPAPTWDVCTAGGGLAHDATVPASIKHTYLNKRRLTILLIYRSSFFLLVYPFSSHCNPSGPQVEPCQGTPSLWIMEWQSSNRVFNHYRSLEASS